MRIAWLDLADDPDAWKAAGFTVAEPSSGPATCVIGGVEHRLHGAVPEQRGVIGWAVFGDGLHQAITEIDGIATEVVDPYEPVASPTHANGVFRIDHLVVRTNDTPRTTEALAAVGLERRGHRDTNSAGDQVDMTFFWAGDVLLELAGPPVPEPEPKPSRLSGIAYASDDLDAAAALLGDRLTRPRDAVQRGRRIAALTSAAGCSTPIALMTPHARTR